MIRNFHKFPLECWQLKFHESLVTLENLMDDFEKRHLKIESFYSSQDSQWSLIFRFNFPTMEIFPTEVYNFLR